MAHRRERATRTWPFTSFGGAMPATIGPIDPRRPERFSTTLPSSPLSYDGQIIKVRWCVRVRVFPLRGKEIVGEKRFQLGDVPPVGVRAVAAEAS